MRYSAITSTPRRWSNSRVPRSGLLSQPLGPCGPDTCSQVLALELSQPLGPCGLDLHQRLSAISALYLGPPARPLEGWWGMKTLS